MPKTVKKQPRILHGQAAKRDRPRYETAKKSLKRKMDHQKEVDKMNRNIFRYLENNPFGLHRFGQRI